MAKYTMEKTIDSGTSFHNVKYQWLATIVANLICLSQGCAAGWLSPALPQLFSDGTTPLLDGPISASQAGWIGAMLSLGGITGTFTMGMLTQVIGTKRSLLLCAGPMLTCWTLIYCAQHVWHIYLARFCVGVTCGGAFICVALFVAEIASAHVRGQLSALLQVNFNTGILLGMMGGTWLDCWHLMPLVAVFMPVVFLLAFAIVPQTPQWLLHCGRAAEAERSLRFYRNCAEDDERVSKEEEMQLGEELDRMKAAAVQSNRVEVKLSDFMTRDAIRGLIIGPTLLAVSQFSGTFVMSNYAATIFAATGCTSLHPNHSAIAFGLLQIAGTICASMLIDRWGRRQLLMLSTGGCALLMGTTAALVYANGHGLVSRESVVLQAVPVGALSLFIFVAAIGIIPVPYVMVAEILPANIRKVGATICTCTVSMFSFTILKAFPLMLAELGLHGCLAVFAGVSLFGLVFSVFVVRETSGRSLDGPTEAEKAEVEVTKI